MEWQRELFREKNFRDVYWRARKFASSPKDTWTTFLVFALLVTVNLAWWLLATSADPAVSLIETVRLWAEAGTVFATSILGFLLAGFAIFASVTKADLFIALAQISYKDTSISRLKYLFFNFLMVFIHYLAFLSLCLLIHLLFATSSPATRLLGLATQSVEPTRFVIAAIGLTVIGTWFAAALLMLKTFIWNLYQSVLLAIATEEQLRKLGEKDPSQKN